MGAISLAIVKLCIIIAFGFWLCRRQVIQDSAVDFLTAFVVNFTAPCMIFSYLIDNAWMVQRYPIWIFLAISLGIYLLGYFLGFLAGVRSPERLKKEAQALISLQNAGYLPLTLAAVLFFGKMKNEFIVYIILYLLGYNILLWSIGSSIIYSDKKAGFNFKNLLTPAISSIALGLLLIYFRLIRYLPPAFADVVFTPIKMIGEVTFVLSMVLLGAGLAKTNLAGIKANLNALIKVSILKLLVMPLLVFFGLVVLKIYSFLGFFVLVQSAMPAAASLVIIAKQHQADLEFTAQGVFVTHLLAILTVGFWMQVYLKAFSLYVK